MLVIRQEQWEAMRGAQREAFYGDLLRKMRTQHPEWCAEESDEATLDLIMWAAAKARTYGLFMAADVTRFVQFVMRYGRDFETHPQMVWARAILNDPDLIGPDKLACIEAQQAAG
ncbi:MAG TPA: hypothetical protein VKP65_17035 [Rhodothermales bacterium]|nr:hypothetical protein [Rhodothermales bacterium]